MGARKPLAANIVERSGRTLRLAVASVVALMFAGWLAMLPNQAYGASGGTPAFVSRSSAPSAFRIQKTANPTVPTAGLSGVSCVSPRSCEAVGNYSINYSIGSDEVVTLAEHWNGTTWKVQSTPHPSGTLPSFLNSVSCVSAIKCEAVGSSNSSDGSVTLAEVWNGSAWNIQSTPNLPQTTLSSVSCVSATSCEAVGSEYDCDDQGCPPPSSLAEVWNGTSWKVQTAPHTPYGGGLNSVSCISATRCEALGDYTNSSYTQLTFAEVWNGATWKLQTTPDPTGVTSSVLSAVSCIRATRCEAVGDYTDNYGKESVTLAEVWNGTRWKLRTTPNPTGATTSVLGSVSCISATRCEAVGSHDSRTLAEVWNGTTWKIQGTGNAGTLVSVSCVSATSCEAVGDHTDSLGTDVTLAEVWKGTTWEIQTTPSPTGATNSVLSAVSCISATRCEAVGDYEYDSYYPSSSVTLAEVWNGGTWKIQTTANPPGATTTVLSAVSCISATRCEAIGSYNYGVASFGLMAEVWDGTEWSLQTTPIPRGATTSLLSSVSCVSATRCEAVGWYTSASDARLALAELWNGTTWAIQSTPNPTGATSVNLSSVSCVSATRCEAVGNAYGSNGTVTLAEIWNGSTWKKQPTPNPAGAYAAYLNSVSCVDASSCEAAGHYYNQSGYSDTLAEVWNGGTWKIQTTANPPGATTTVLSAVSCVRSTSCEAVGNYNSSSDTDFSMAEVWNGTAWKMQITPNPSGKNASLSSVSCVSATGCEAVGSYTSGSGVTQTLAMRGG